MARSMIFLEKTIAEKCPRDLEKSIFALDASPSIRMCKEFYEHGIQYLKNNHLYLPIIPYSARLVFWPDKSTMGVIALDFRRYWKNKQDRLIGTIISENNSFALSVERKTGGRFEIDQVSNSTPFSMEERYESLIELLNAKFAKFPVRFMKLNNPYASENTPPNVLKNFVYPSQSFERD